MANLTSFGQGMLNQVRNCSGSKQELARVVEHISTNRIHLTNDDFALIVETLYEEMLNGGESYFHGGDSAA